MLPELLDQISGSEPMLSVSAHGASGTGACHDVTALHRAVAARGLNY